MGGGQERNEGGNPAEALPTSSRLEAALHDYFQCFAASSFTCSSVRNMATFHDPRRAKFSQKPATAVA